MSSTLTTAKNVSSWKVATTQHGSSSRRIAVLVGLRHRSASSELGRHRFAHCAVPRFHRWNGLRDPVRPEWRGLGGHVGVGAPRQIGARTGACRHDDGDRFFGAEAGRRSAPHLPRALARRDGALEVHESGRPGRPARRLRPRRHAAERVQHAPRSLAAEPGGDAAAQPGARAGRAGVRTPGRRRSESRRHEPRRRAVTPRSLARSEDSLVGSEQRRHRRRRRRRRARPPPRRRRPVDRHELDAPLRRQQGVRAGAHSLCRRQRRVGQARRSPLHRDRQLRAKRLVRRRAEPGRRLAP